MSTYREAALADGWQPIPDCDYRLTRDGFMIFNSRFWIGI